MGASALSGSALSESALTASALNGSALTVLGISAYYHDAAAAVVSGGEVIAAAEEERFTRIKHDANLPLNAIRFCLDRAGVLDGSTSLDAVVFYDKPLTTFDRIMSTVLHERRRSWPLFRAAMPSWMSSKLWVPMEVERGLKQLGVDKAPKLKFSEHHLSHAASAFYPSPFDEAAVLTIDGVGEWATTSIGFGDHATLAIDRQIEYPHSLGLLYSAATSYCGFRVNSGEYKLMGLAPYGNPRFASQVRHELIELDRDGSFRLNLDRFGFMRGEAMITDDWAGLFDGPARELDGDLDQRIADVAASFQLVLEDAVLGLAAAAHRTSGSSNLCMAGGVALNCVANGRVSRESPFEHLWVQPASSDAGGALGAALMHYWAESGATRTAKGAAGVADGMHGSLLGPEFSDDEIATYLAEIGAVATTGHRDEINGRVAELLADGQIVAVLRGRMEYGPRALGNRSILGDPRNTAMQRDLNVRTKMRESFRPFAPAVLVEHGAEYFDLTEESPYMLVVSEVTATQRRGGANQAPDDFVDQVNQVRSTIPAVTHVDHSARVQTVDPERHRDFHGLISAFYDLTGCPLVINTSFNVRGQPIVCTPQDAYECFMATGIDYLVLGDHLLAKTDQPDATEHRLDVATLVPD